MMRYLRILLLLIVGLLIISLLPSSPILPSAAKSEVSSTGGEAATPLTPLPPKKEIKQSPPSDSPTPPTLVKQESSEVTTTEQGVVTPPISTPLNEKIKWLTIPSAPFGIIDGEEKQKGIVDLINLELSRHLVEYDHEYLSVPFKRMLAEIKNQQNYCIGGLIQQSERQQYLYFSEFPSTVLTPFSVIFRKKERPLFEKYAKNGGISLTELLNDSPLKLGLMQEVSIGSVLDEIVKKNAKKGQNIEEFQPGDLTDRSINILSFERVNYIITYRWLVLHGLEKQEGKSKPELDSFNIIEDTTPVFYHVACTKNEWGRKIIDKVNQFLPNLHQQPEYRHIVERWMPAGELENYQQIYDKSISEYLKK